MRLLGVTRSAQRLQIVIVVFASKAQRVHVVYLALIERDIEAARRTGVILRPPEGGAAFFG